METMRRFSRRTFVAWVGGAGAGFYLFGRVPGLSAPAALAQVPGGSLDPTTVPKYQTPLLILWGKETRFGLATVDLLRRRGGAEDPGTSRVIRCVAGVDVARDRRWLWTSRLGSRLW